MGSLGGHLLPGVIFIGLALWWVPNILSRYFRSRTKTGQPFRSATWFPCRCCPNFALEPLIKIIAITIGMAGEFITAIEGGHFTHMGNSQHMTMFFFFGLAALIEILLFYKFPLPEDLDYLCSLLAYAVEGLLFYFHLHGRSPMDVHVHMLLFISVAMCVISGSFEMRYRDNVLAALSRTFFTILQGTWICHVGFILYPPFKWMTKWDQNDHQQIMLVTAMFTWHCIGILIGMFVTGWVIFRQYYRYELFCNIDSYVQVNTKNGHIQVDSESEGV